MRHYRTVLYSDIRHLKRTHELRNSKTHKLKTLLLLSTSQCHVEVYNGLHLVEVVLNLREFHLQQGLLGGNHFEITTPTLSEKHLGIFYVLAERNDLLGLNVALFGLCVVENQGVAHLVAST